MIDIQWVIDAIDKYATVRDNDGDLCMESGDWRITLLGGPSNPVTIYTETIWVYLSKKKGYEFHNIIAEKHLFSLNGEIDFLKNVKVRFAHYAINAYTELNIVELMIKNLLPEIYKKICQTTAAAVTIAPTLKQASPLLSDAPNEPCAVCSLRYGENVRVAKFNNQVRCWQHCY